MPFARSADAFKIGDVKFHGRAALPAGWLWCDGSAVSRTTYAALFAAISTAYGAGDGSTTFNVPDLRGRFPAGKDNMGVGAASRLTTAGSSVDGATLGATGGAQNHTLTAAQSATLQTQTGGAVGGSANAAWGPSNTTSSGNISTVNSGGGAHLNVPPCQVFNYIVKAF